MTLPGWSDRIERFRDYVKAVGSQDDVEHRKSGERSPARSAELSRQ